MIDAVPRSRPRAARSTASSAMFATTTSRGGQLVGERVGDARLELDAVRGGVLARSTSTARGSTSTRDTGAKPSCAAAIASTPEPQPTSSRLPARPARRAARGRAASSRARRCRTRGPGRSRPRARPASGASHGGPTQSGPTRTGRWNARQRSSQPSLDVGRRARRRSACAEPLLAAPRRCTRRARRRRRVDLLEALREELEHARARLLGPRGRRP